MISSSGLYAAALELKARRDARVSLLAHCKYFDPLFMSPRHILRVIEGVEAVVRGDILRLMVIFPPQHGKSHTISTLAPPWILQVEPEWRIILASYGAGLARTFSGRARDIVASPEYERLYGLRLSNTVRSSSRWQLQGHLGGMLAVGTSGGSTGNPANLYIMDDLIRDAAEADSLLQREKKWEWYTKAALSRLAPKGRIIFPTTRWHIDDPAGRAIKSAGYHVIHEVALDADNHALWEEFRSAEELIARREEVGERAFEAVWQGNPLPGSGLMFDAQDIRVIDWGDVDWTKATSVVRYWDKAASTKATATLTAGLLLITVRNGNENLYVIANLTAGHFPVAKREEIITSTLIEDTRKWPMCRTAVEQEPASGGLESADNTLERNAQFGSIIADPPQGGKVARAEPAAVLVAAHKVCMIRGDWNHTMLMSLSLFPFGVNDPVDALSGALKVSRMGSAQYVGVSAMAKRNS